MKRHSLLIMVLTTCFLMIACENLTDPETNEKPVAKAGSDQTVTLGATVQLDGSASSDADGDTLTYAWSLTAKPEGSPRQPFQAPTPPSRPSFQTRQGPIP